MPAELRITNLASHLPEMGWSSKDQTVIVSDGQISDRVEVLAPAKLNLFLEILGKRSDGYHDLESLMVTIDLFDRLNFTDDPSGRITLVCDDPTMPTGPANLVVQAAYRLRQATGCGDRGARINLNKAIPSQAGLAGGSSDAASTLAALDRLWNLKLSNDDLDAIAATIGSDVAFFRQGPAAICRGRGERVEAIRLAGPLHFVLICPTIGVSTPLVYRNLIPPSRPRSIGEILEALGSGDAPGLGRLLFNRLQPVAESLAPPLAKVRDALTGLVGSSQLDGSLMSGSGSAYFGLARDRGAAEGAATQLESLGLGRVRVVTCGL